MWENYIQDWLADELHPRLATRYNLDAKELYTKTISKFGPTSHSPPVIIFSSISAEPVIIS